ncbi:MAG: carboxy terminal-processing peptidase [Saprospiraceae bacterium]
MKFRGSIYFSIALLAVLLAGFYYPATSNAEKEAILIQRLLGGLKQLHYKPVEIDNNFSQKVFDLYMERLDSGKRWLTQKDVDKLEKYKNLIDDEAATGNYEFFNMSIDLLEKGVDKTRAYYKEFVDAPVDMNSSAMIELDGEKKAFAKNDEELKAYWKEMTSYEIMTEVAAMMKKKEEDHEDYKDKSEEEMLKEARAKVLKDFDAWYKRMDKRKRTVFLSSYINSITNVFDPHTTYFAPKDKENFDIRMSGTLEGIGAQLREDGEHTLVVRIIPGGPAWKGKELEEKDLITKVAQKGEDAVDVTGMPLDEVVQLIRGKKGTEVNLTVKKVDGSEDVISITRDIVQLEDSYAKSVILDLEKPNKKVANIGYIKLPQFYADFSRRNGRSCAKDIAKELEKLKGQDVNGIILDLRNNGGGSLRDVQEMSGFFIEEGPIVQVKARNHSPEILADKNPEVQYDGPLIVMVNAFSASASEILAAALQDYGRAVIVGSNATFGKGTVQRFIDLDQGFRGNDDITPLGEVKLTIQKFYRVNGGSTQLKGVTPDILLPDRYHYFDLGEREHEYAMEWTEIDAVPYKQNVTELEGLDELKAASKQRVASSEPFQKVLEQAKFTKEKSEKTAYPLNLEKFQAERKSTEEQAKQYEDMFTEIEGLKAKNLEEDVPNIKIDESKEAMNDEWLEAIRKDIYIEEALQIMKDMTQK